MGTAIFSEVERAVISRRGRNLEYFTIAWAGLEAAIALVTAIHSNSLSLAGWLRLPHRGCLRSCIALENVPRDGSSSAPSCGTHQSAHRRCLPAVVGCLHPDRGHFQSLDAPRCRDELDRSRNYDGSIALHALCFHAPSGKWAARSTVQL